MAMNGSVRKLPKALNQLNFSQDNRFNTTVAVPGFIMKIWLCAVVGAAEVEILKGSRRTDTGKEPLALPVEAPVRTVSSVQGLEGRVEPSSRGVEPLRNQVETTGTRVASATAVGLELLLVSGRELHAEWGAESRSLGSLCPTVSNPHGLQHNGSAFPVPCSYLRSTNLDPYEHGFPGNVSRKHS